MFQRFAAAAVTVACLALFSLAYAQQESGERPRAGERPRQRQRGQGQPERGRGRPSAAQMQERMLQGMQRQLGVSEEEWKTIAPSLKQIVAIQWEMRSGARMMRRPGVEDGDQASATLSMLAAAQRDLARTLEQQDASADEITSKLKALREARNKARKEMQDAQKKLKQEVKPRQEAILVLDGILD